VSQKAIPGRSATPWGAIITFLVGLIYGVSPLDLLPDIIPVLGLVDDVVMVPLMILISVILLVRRYQGQTTVTAPPRAAVIDVPVIPDSYERAR